MIVKLRRYDQDKIFNIHIFNFNLSGGKILVNLLIKYIFYRCWLIDFWEKENQGAETGVRSERLFILIWIITPESKTQSEMTASVLSLENNFYLFCAITHVSVKHLNLEADASYPHHKAYEEGTLIALTWLCHRNNFKYKRDEDVNTDCNADHRF